MGKKNLICESGPDKQYGYLSTKEFYDDFELTLEFKQEANGNSGVFIRSTVDGIKVDGGKLKWLLQDYLRVEFTNLMEEVG